MSKQNTNCDFSKAELFFNIIDGDQFQVKKHMKHLYTYHKDKEEIVDENGELISSDVLLYLIHHPYHLVNQTQSSASVLSDTYSMIGKFSLYMLMFFFFALLTLKFLAHQTVDFGSISFLIPFLICLLSILGTGVSAGVVVTKMLDRKEVFL